MYKAVVFDFDYTLGDSTNGIVLSVNYALDNLGYPIKSVREIRRTIGLSLGETFAALTECSGAEQSERFSRLFVEKADEVMTENSVLYADAEYILGELKARGVKTAIVSTKFHYRIEEILSKFSASDLVGAIIGGEDVKRQKPAPDGLLAAIELLDAEKTEVLYVGDSLVDAKTAQAAGVDFAGTLTGTASKSEFDKFERIYVGENLRDIYNFITKQ